MREDTFPVPADPAAVVSSCRETRLGNTLYRVINVSSKNFDWGRTLENLAVRQAVSEAVVPDSAVSGARQEGDMGL